ncbi:MAG: hypothetical protein EOM88_00415 [Clostridia bacterium]|nr:hypothetical protein [Clostridia bacterium]
MRFFLVSVFTFFCLYLPSAVFAQLDYPLLANYFLKWDITEEEAVSLSRWDLLILDMEIQENQPELIKKIRQLNPEIKILAYITSQEIIDDVTSYSNNKLRQKLSRQIIEDWRLKDQTGAAVINWPNTSMFNLSNEAGRNEHNQLFNEFLPEFIKDNIYHSGLWDGIFYDNTWGDIFWVNNGDIDLNRDGKKDKPEYADFLWQEGFNKVLNSTRILCGPDFLVMGNGRIYWPYQSLLNGMMLEGFPSSWENGGTWQGSMESYLKLADINQKPFIPVINVYENNQENYKRFRFGLASTLLGDGYYSFDYDVTSHGQLWWYDEYDYRLGTAQSKAYNILNNSSQEIEPGIWRRDFEYASVILNSTNEAKRLVFDKEEFEKITGKQDTLVNSGLKINHLNLASNDGIVLLKKIDFLQGTSFTNGSFIRIYDDSGRQSRNGFFSYLPFLPAGSDVIAGHFLNDRDLDYIYLDKGVLNLQRNDKKIWSIRPFAPGFKGSASIVVADINGDSIPEIIIGAGPGGGPQVLVFDFDGRVLINFFAYDNNFRGGVNVAAADINGNGKAEIITGAGPGGGPHVRIFDETGKFLSHFFAYDEKLRDGVKLAAGDLDGDAKAEIFTVDASGSGSLIKIFDLNGQEKNNFQAFDKDFKNIISISYANNLNQSEIAIGISEF